MISTNRFFHLPALYVYLLAAILLVTSVFHAAGLVRQGLYLVLGLNDTFMPTKFSSDVVTFTPEAENYLSTLAIEHSARTTRAGLVRSALLLVISFGSFLLLWRRTNRSMELEMPFSVRNFYFFLVSAVAFLIFFYSLSHGITNLVHETMVGDSVAYYDVYRFSPPIERTDGKPQPRLVDKDEVVRNLETQRKENAMHRKSSQKRQIVDQLTISLVALPVFFLHDRKFGF